MPDPPKLSGGRLHTRGYLPHVDAEGTTQFITFRLADSMPQHLHHQWRAELSAGEITDADLRKRIEHFLDSGYGSCALRDRRVANEIRETLIKWNGKRYRLIAWVVMLNHVHLLIELNEGFTLSEVMHSIKSYTAHQANKIREQKGRFWSVESFDRYIRDSRHFRNTIKYIEDNPVKAGLCKRREDWEFSSAYIPM
jgi:REP element-mobilizing transposase RayT